MHWAHRVVDRFPDGQLYVNLRGFEPADVPVGPAAATRRLLDSLGVAPQRIPAGLEAQTALYRSLLADRRMLVVLDNARDAEQVRPLLPGSPTCLVVLTSRNRLASLVATSSARSLMLDVLSDAEAWQLLETRIGATRVAAEARAVQEIVARCVRLPLALAIVAARVTTNPGLSLTALAEELTAARLGLDAFDGDDDPLTDLRAVFAGSYRQLSADAARLFRLLGLHPGPDIGEPAAASLAGLPPDQVEPLLLELSRAQLITEPTPRRYTFHDLLRAYAAELVQAFDDEADRGLAIRRVLDYYLHAAYTADRLLDPDRSPITFAAPLPGVALETLAGPDQAMRWMVTEHQVLLAVIHQADGAGHDTHVWTLAWSMSTFLDWQGHWRELTTNQLLAVAATERLEDVAAQAFAYRGLARAHARLGDNDEACKHLLQALDLHGRAGDHVSQGNTHLALSWVTSQLGDHSASLDHNLQALTLFEADAHGPGKAAALNGIGFTHAMLGNHREALTYCEQALTQFQELGARGGQADTWESLGRTHQQLGQYDQAIASYRNAIELYQDLGHRAYEATTLSRLGDTCQAAGLHDDARLAWEQALEILTQLNHPEVGELSAKLEQAINPTLAAR